MLSMDVSSMLNIILSQKYSQNEITILTGQCGDIKWANYKQVRINQKTSLRQKRDQKIAAILILLVSVFACCNFVRIVTNVYEVKAMSVKYLKHVF